MTKASHKFRAVRVQGWRQFGHVELELHPRLTVITGANGAGKSSLLRIFSRHFGFDRPYLATPKKGPGGGYAYVSDIFGEGLRRLWDHLFASKQRDGNSVGVLTYSNGTEATLRVPANPGVQYSIEVQGQQSVPGIHIDSHQPVSHFQQVGQIPTTIITPEAAFNNYNSELMGRYQGGHSGHSPTYRMKEAIIAMAMFGEGNKHVQRNETIVEAYEGFVEALRKILPESLGFLELAVRPPEVVLVTKSGEFLIDAASGGIMTLIDFTWRLYMFSTQHSEFVVTIDEPENHLHPMMQRSLMGKLIEAFPNAQFIIATHSPFMVSSVQDSNVYVLRYQNSFSGERESGLVMPSETSRVVSEKLDTINKAGSASDILREVLGVPATVPVWVEARLAEIVQKYRDLSLSDGVLRDLRAELDALGYEAHYPDALAQLLRVQ